MPSIAASGLRAPRANCLALFLILLSLAACPAYAIDRKAIDADVDAALAQLFDQEPATRDLAKRAAAVLTFPRVIKAGLVVGAQGGQGALRRNGETTGYYRTAAVSYGLQVGVQTFGYALFFMGEDDLDYLERSDGFELGSAPSLVIADRGAAGSVSTTTAKDGIVAYFFSQKGLMGGIGIQGTKITKIGDD